MGEHQHSSGGAPAEETTPLLTESMITPSPNSETQEQGRTASNDDAQVFPRAQIFLLCAGRLAEPIAFFSIFPFINQMVWEVGGVDDKDVGFYSGLIVCGLEFLGVALKVDRSRYFP